MAGLWDDFDTATAAPSAPAKRTPAGLWDDFDHPPAPPPKPAAAPPPPARAGLGDLLTNALAETLGNSPMGAAALAAQYPVPAAKGVGSGMVGMGRDLVSMPLGGLAVLADRGASLFTDKPYTGLEDAVFHNLVDPSYAMQAKLAPAQDAGKAEQVAHQVGSFLPDLAAMAATGGETAAPRVLTRVPEIIEQALLHATRASALPAVEHGVDTAQQVQQATGDTGQALRAGATEALTTPLANMLPLNAPGGLLSRAVQGAVSGIAGQRLQNALVNPTLPAELQRPNDDSTAGIIGSLMAAALGPRAAGATHAPAPRPAPEGGRTEPPPALAPEDTRDLDAMLADVNARAQPPAPEAARPAPEASPSAPAPEPRPEPAPRAAAQPDALANAKRAFDDTVKEAVAAGADPRAYAAHVAARFGVSADAILHTPDVASEAATKPGAPAAEPRRAEPEPARPTESAATAEQPVFSRAPSAPAAPDTPAFRRFFEGSQVVDREGRPLPVYHGTAEDFHVFSGDAAGEATGHATSPLGHFFTPDRAQAERYAENASEGRPADQRVVDAYLAVRKPYTMPLREAQAIESPQQARQVRARLEAQGYDGIRIPEADTVVAFRPEQIKSASENRGTFDAANPDIRFSQSAETNNLGNAREPSGIPGEGRDLSVRSLQPAEGSGEKLPRGELAGNEQPARARLQIEVQPRAVAPEHLNRVRNVANDVASGLRNAPKIEVLSSPDELPPGLRERVRSDPAEAGMPDGMFVPGRNTVYLFAGAIPDARRAAWVVMHEVAGHYGLRGLLGNELSPALRRASRNDTVSQLAEAIKRDRGELDMDPLRATEEALAELAAALRTGDFEGIAQRYGVEVPDTMRGAVRSTIQRFVEAVRELLRRVTGRTDRFTDTDVHRLLEDAWRYVRDGESAPAPRRAAEAPMRATETAAGERTIARGEDRFVQRGSDYYLADADGTPRDFASADDAQAAAERVGGEVRQDEPIEGEPRTWSVVLPEGQAAAGERQLLSRTTRGEAEVRAEARRDELRRTLGGPTQGGAIGWDFNEDRWEGTQGTLQRWRTKLQDKMIAWRDVQQDIAAALGRAIPDAQNVYRMENLMHGRVKEGIDRLEHDRIAPMVKAMRDAGVKPETLERYLYARHAKERNAEIAKINPDMPDGGSGLTNAEADAILQELAPQRGVLDTLATHVDALVKQTRRSLLDHGLITREQFDAMEAQYKHYVPLRGRNAEQPDLGAQGGGAGRGVDTRPAPVKAALGRGAGNKATNILGHVIGDAQRAIILGEKARVGRTVLRLVLANPNPRLWRVEPVQTERRLNAAGEVYEAVVNDWSDPSIVAVRHAGKLYKVQFEHPELSKALNLVGVDQMGELSRFAGRINRYFSAVLTRYNPAFIPVNATRDMIFGLTSLAAEHGEGAALRTLANYPKALRAAAREARRADVKSATDRYAREFAEDGGKTGYVSMPSVEDIQRTIGRGKLNRYDPRGLAKVAHLIADMTGIANDAVENGMRLAAYITLRERGMAREQAAQYAKDFTINFNRKGYSGSAYNAWLLFYNASMQGAHRFGQVMKNKKAWAYVGGLAAAQALAAMYAMSQQDEDGTSLWDKVPEHVKQRNLVFTWRNDAGEQHLITVPMPYGFNLFTYMAGRGTQAVVDNLDGRDSPQDHAAAMAADMLSSSVQAFSPIPLDDGALGVVPTFARIPIAVQINRNDFGREIHREDDYGKFDVPRASLGRPDTLELFKVAARGLNRLGGGDDYTPPPLSAFDVAPEDIQYVLQELGGGLGKFVMDSATFAQKATNPELDVSARDVPITSKFYSNVDEQASQRSMFYERADAIERDKARVLDTYEREGPEAAAVMLKTMPTLEGATFKRYKRSDPAKGHFAGDVILEDGRPQLVARDDDSVFGLYKKAAKGTREQGQEVRQAYTAAPPGLLPNAERDRAIREAERKRYDVQRAFNAAWNRAVVPDGE